ncbi:MAG: aminotransferase class III-fold pyridoxal phosphate-dependent enzyme [Candidatus Bathyarchaeota archaeon]|nr:MAG: aminotransferase class III-fold pyridoxal phosphate-dependent enzyme [Candidatus Bathyarchaeota archaeon]
MKNTLEILRDHYGIENANLQQLDSDGRKLNYLVSTSQGQKFVFKQYKTKLGLQEYLDAENQILQLLTKHVPYAFPEPQRNLNGEFITNIEHGKKLGRLLTFIKGRFLSEVNHSTRLFHSIGSFLAEMDQALTSFRHPAIEARQLDWDLQHCLDNQRLAIYIEELQRRKLVDYFFLQFRETVLPEIRSLRKSTIHADVNDWNLIVRKGQVAGIIDFSDVVYSPLINELAVTVTYAILGKQEPIKWACYIIEEYTKVLPLEDKEVALLYYLIAARLCTSVCISAYNKKQYPDNKHLTVSEKPAWDMLERWITISPIQATKNFRHAAGFQKRVYSPLQKSLNDRMKHISKSLSITYSRPIRMVKAAFQYMYDAGGRTYLDARNNIPHVGHCHPKVVQAGQRQMATLNTNTRYLYDQLNDYSSKLLAKFPKPLSKVFFVNSGSAASDLAIRLAYTHTGRRKILVVEHGYHGNTKTGIEISPYKYEGKGGQGQVSHVVKAPIPDTYRGKYKQNSKEAGKQYANEAIELLNANGGDIAAFICEPVIGGGGQVPLPSGYLKEMYGAIRTRGGVCISDEVQTGFGRLGGSFWGFQTQNVVPDIVVLGKPMGNGHPIAAVVTTDEVTQSFENGMEFFSSYGGNPVSCAIGLAVLEVIEEERLQENALVVGNYLKQKLSLLTEEHTEVGDIRGTGFFLGIELVKNQNTFEPHTELAQRLKNQLKENGILVGTDGPYENVIKIKPPMCFTQNNAQQLVDELERCL